MKLRIYIRASDAVLHAMEEELGVDCVATREVLREELEQWFLTRNDVFIEVDLDANTSTVVTGVEW